MLRLQILGFFALPGVIYTIFLCWIFGSHPFEVYVASVTHFTGSLSSYVTSFILFYPFLLIPFIFWEIVKIRKGN